MSQDNQSREPAEVVGEEHQHDGVVVTTPEKASTGNTRMELGLLPIWTLNRCRLKCAGMMDVKHFGFMTELDRNFVIYNLNCFERDTALGTRKCRWVVLSQ